MRTTFIKLIALVVVCGLPCLVACTSLENRVDGAAPQGSAKIESPTNITIAPSSMPVPEGVEPEVWKLLATELEKQLIELHGAERVMDSLVLRTVGSPPSGSAAAAPLAFDAGTSTLNWGYYSPGDYDQNGEVNVADITPIVLHFGESGEFDADSIQAVVDGDGNGEINTADITPIAMNFGALVTEFHIYASANEADYPADGGDNGPGALLIAVVALESATSGTDSRRQFSYPLEDAQPFNVYWVRLSDGVAEGTPSSLVGETNPWPIAVLSANPATGPALLKVTFDASASSDPDGLIVRYEWDFDGNGYYEYDTGTAPTTDFYYYEAGSYTTTVRVTDNDGLTGTAQFTVETTEGAQWHYETVLETDPDIGPEFLHEHTALIEANGRPGIAFVVRDDEHDRGLGFIRAGDSLGTSWGTYGIIGPGSGETRIVSWELPIYLINVGGQPTIIYDTANSPSYKDYRIRTALDEACTNWSQALIVPEVPISPPVIISGNPAFLLKHTDPSGDFVRALGPTGFEWNEAVEILPLSMVSKSLAVIENKPAFAFTYRGDVMYIRAEDTLGDTWPGEPQALLAEGDDKFSTKLIDAGGYPAIAYREGRSILFVRALDPTGFGWGEPVVVDIWADGDILVAKHLGRPVVLYTDLFSGGIRLIAANDAEGKSWGLPVKVTSGEPEDEISFPEILETINGNPAFCSYYRKPGSDPIEDNISYVSYY